MAAGQPKIFQVDIAYIGLGSNLGESQQILLEAWENLGSVVGVDLGRLSHPYKTEPVGMVSDNWFVNAAGEIKTSLAPVELLAKLHDIERQFGRERDPAIASYQDRTLDLDLLLYDQAILSKNNVHIPHPSLQDRLFVLLPLCEIAPQTHHPLLKKSMKKLLAELQMTGGHLSAEMLEWVGIQEG